MVIENIEICGTFAGDPKPLKVLIRSKIKTKPGDKYDPRALKKNFNAVWSLNRFESLRIEFRKGKRGIIVVYNSEGGH